MAVRTIVIGVDGWPTSGAALPWALAEARHHGAMVRAVRAGGLPYDVGEIGHLLSEETWHE